MMMKKWLFLWVMLLGMVPAMAQSVVYDQTSSNGVRTLICEGVNLEAVGDVDVNVALAGFEATNGTVLYSLAVVVGSGSSVTIPAGSKCVLTLTNGKQYELETVSGGTSVLQNMDVQMDRVYQSYQRFAYYNIKKSVLKKLKKGVSRIEIQMQPRTYAVSFDVDALGTLFLNSREVIDSAFGK